MKKLFMALLVLAMVIGLAACQGEKKPTEISEVDYYCNVGAYRITLEKAINEFNEGAGKEAGVKINFLGDINNYTTSLQAAMDAGTHYDLYDKGSGNQQWIQQGWVLDLYSIQKDYPELDAMIKSYEKYIAPGVNIQDGYLCNLPLEVVPLKFAVNTDLLEKNNLKVEDIKTWEDMYNAAKTIRENAVAAGRDEFGFGWCTWGACWTRLTFQACCNSTGKNYWDPNTGSYDFQQWKEPCEYIKKMYKEGIMLGADDLAIDPIRAEFAKGRVGFFGAPSYDYAVYTEQFPAECNWTVIDPPTFGDNPNYKGTYLDRCGTTIDKVAWDAASDAKKAAIVKALCFINSDDLLQRIYEMGGLISYKPEISQKAKVSADMGPQWALFGDVANYRNVALVPDSVCKNYLEGDIIATTFDDWMHDKWQGKPEATFDEVAKDLEDRYNAAWAKAKADKEIDTSIYEYEYSLAK